MRSAHQLSNETKSWQNWQSLKTAIDCILRREGLTVFEKAARGTEASKYTVRKAKAAFNFLACVTGLAVLPIGSISRLSSKQ